MNGKLFLLVLELICQCYVMLVYEFIIMQPSIGATSNIAVHPSCASNFMEVGKP